MLQLSEDKVEKVEIEVDMSNFYFYIAHQARKSEIDNTNPKKIYGKLVLDQCYFEVLGVRLSTKTYEKSIRTKLTENYLPCAYPNKKDNDHGNYVNHLELDWYNERIEEFIEYQYRCAFNLEFHKVLLKNDYSLAYILYKS